MTDIHLSTLPTRRQLLRAALGATAGLTAGPLLTACSDPYVEVDRDPPTVTGSTPAASATGVSRTAAIEIDFSESVTAADGAITLTGPRGPVAATVVVNSNRATVTPTRRLGSGERYTVAAGSGVRDRSGNTLTNTSLSFTTQPRNTAIALGGIVMDSYVRRRWSNPASNPWNPMAQLVDNGFEWLRVAVITQSLPELRSTTAWHSLPWRNEYWSSLEVSGALLRDGADLACGCTRCCFSATKPLAGVCRSCHRPGWGSAMPTWRSGWNNTAALWRCTTSRWA